MIVDADFYCKELIPDPNNQGGLLAYLKQRGEYVFAEVLLRGGLAQQMVVGGIYRVVIEKRE